MKKMIACLILMMIGSGCSRNAPNSTVDDVNEDQNSERVIEDGLPLQIASLHFMCFCLDRDSTQMRAAFNRLESEYFRILDDLEVTSLPLIRVKAWSNETVFYAEMASVFNGLIYHGATGYLNGLHEIRLLYPRVDETTFVHEFAHVVSLALNPSISNHPRWLWEAVALFEAGEFINPAQLSYIRQGEYPTLQELDIDYNSSNHRIYQLGYVIAAFIRETLGRSTLVDLIRRNGDLEAVLGISAAEFEMQLYTFIVNEYL